MSPTIHKPMVLRRWPSTSGKAWSGKRHVWRGKEKKIKRNVLTIYFVSHLVNHLVNLRVSPSPRASSLLRHHYLRLPRRAIHHTPTPQPPPRSVDALLWREDGSPPPHTRRKHTDPRRTICKCPKMAGDEVNAYVGVWDPSGRRVSVNLITSLTDNTGRRASLLSSHLDLIFFSLFLLFITLFLRAPLPCWDTLQ